MRSNREKLMEVQKQNRIQWLDVLKCLTMILVVIGHASKGDTTDIIFTRFICRYFL